MSAPRKVISVVPIDAPKAPEDEIRGCAELEPYALRVLGDSMAPEFVDGQVIIVEPASSAESGRFVIAAYEGEVYFRQYIVEGNQRILKAVNSDCPAVAIISSNFQIRGIVVQRTGPRRSQRKNYY